MTGFKPRTSIVGSDRSTNWVTTTAPNQRCYVDAEQGNKNQIFAADSSQTFIQQIFGEKKLYLAPKFKIRRLVFLKKIVASHSEQQ